MSRIKMFIPSKYRSMSSDELDDYINYEVLNAFHWHVFLMIDYNNYHKDDDYDGGLSFINRICNTLGWLHPEWNLEELRKSIKNERDYINIIKNMLDDDACCSYGLENVKNGFDGS